jgi:hypothetical protein
MSMPEWHALISSRRRQVEFRAIAMEFSAVAVKIRHDRSDAIGDRGHVRSIGVERSAIRVAFRTIALGVSVADDAFVIG